MAKTPAELQAARRERNKDEYLGAMVLPTGSKAQLKALADREGLKLPQMIARLVQSYDQPRQSNADIAAKLWEQSGHDFRQAKELLKAYMRDRYEGFKASVKDPRYAEYKALQDAIRYLHRTIHK